MPTDGNSTSTARQYKLSRAEQAWPQNDWEQTWRRARLRGLGPETTTFVWRLLHNILPTQERTSRIASKTPTSPLCKLCQDQLVEDQMHAFFHCKNNSNASKALLSSINSILPNTTPRQVLLLEFHPEESQEFAVVWTIGHFLQLVWTSRVQKKQVRLYTIRAELEARASLLRETRHRENLEKINEMIKNFTD